MKSKLCCSLVVVGAVALLGPGRAVAGGSGITIEARMFLRSTGELDRDLFTTKGDRPKVGNLDYGTMAEEMLIMVTVSGDIAADSLTITVSQGKRSTTQTSRLHGHEREHVPMLVVPAVCSPPMTITARAGKATVKRTIEFPCAE